jgi:hypothetical protein
VAEERQRGTAKMTVDFESQKISDSRRIPASGAEIFVLLSDASRHNEIDGSDTVKGARAEGSVPLVLGTKFVMDMKLKVLPYKITNEVVEFEQDRLIAWNHFGGHRWRYELEPVEGGTLVTETFDWSTAFASGAYRFLPQLKTHPESIRATLERLDALLG